ncbi:General secretion pathway protein K [Posidoniimonas polymericola]|uniref:General secretion pathway protein K n=1 Tax=Posidoniimonas polymericola TaxID=2528002 RepID=A0A5C5XWX1_9BACT|nr:type II secretion system protein GspK [Posidoniimonas polymericola]TWT67011.1 General secretion pathway protein K [Posidoniimonas polymericola]
MSGPILTDGRRGSVLLVVLVVVALMTIGGMAYFDWSFIEHRAAQAYARQIQSRALADSGIVMVETLLLEEPLVLEQQGGLYQNPSLFQGVVISDSDAAALRARVSIVAPLMDYGEYIGYRFGLENESARLNLNTLLLADDYAENGARLQLMALPGMTESIADAILDWLDEDDDIRDLGAESQYYSSLDEPYEPINGPLESIDQLLMVRDVSVDLLYGLDSDRNGVVSPAESMRVLPGEIDNSTGQMNRGWAAYFTLYSAEALLTPEGEAKIDVNMEDLEELHSLLEAALGVEQANFIVAYRQGGAADADANNNAISAAGVSIDFQQPGSETITSLLSLVGVDVEFSDNGAPAVLRSPFPESAGSYGSFLPDLLDNLTVSSSETMVGRLNVNQAPRALLNSIPNMPVEAVEQIIAARTPEVTPDRPERRHAEWIMMDGIVDLETMKQLAPLLTGGGDVYRVQSIGFFDEEGPSTRIEAVIDDTGPTPKLLSRLDLTPLGAGYSAAELGATDPTAAGDSPAP